MPYLYSIRFACFLSSAQLPCCPSVRFIHAFPDESTFLSLIPLPFSSPSLTFSLAFIPSLPLNMRSLFTLFFLVASACAYQVLTPGNSVGWTTAGNNNVTWTRVSTDPTTFTMVLVNQVRSPSLTRLFSPTWASFCGTSGQDRYAIWLGNPHCDGRRQCRRDRRPRTKWGIPNRKWLPSQLCQ